MATQPATDDDDDTRSHGDVGVKEKEMGQRADGGDTKGLIFESTLGLKMFGTDHAAWDKKIGTILSRNMLPKQLVSHQVEETPTIQNSDYEVFFETLKVSNASQLLSLPRNLLSLRIKGCESLDVLPNDLFDGLTFLKELELIDCSSLISIPYPTSLTTLNIRNCRNFELLPSLESRKRLSSIHTLSIGNSCDSLTTLSLDFFPKLKDLSIRHCPNFLSLNVTGIYTGDLALKSLQIIDCLGFNSFPDEEFHTPNLNSIILYECQNLYKFPDFVKSLASLLTLYVVRCPHIESFSNGGLPSSLTFLSIDNCDKLTSQKDWGLENLKSLTAFKIRGGCIGMKSFPEEKLLPKTITSLCITDLKSLTKLDDKGFQQLKALLKLEIYYCDVLQHLPEQGLPSTLVCLDIYGCPMLTPSLKPETGKYWRMVAHIKSIIIDNQRVRE
ncbi:unnamed protein product [Trifolium pratense]|uniref:Uncharacterized protein n=1 Tax=Trifolium pratense TaxID=57577 RepID=A0ACB0KGT6_TRIPR|nr:unnamed protein product [Trifolium pratense]